MAEEKHIHIHIQLPEEGGPGAPDGIDPHLGILEKLNTMSEAMDNLVREVAEMGTAVDGVLTIVGGLRAQLADAIASGDTTQLQQLATDLQAYQDKLASAAVVNTPAVDPAASETPPLPDPIAAPPTDVTAPGDPAPEPSDAGAPDVPAAAEETPPAPDVVGE